MLGHLGGCRFFGADGAELPAADVARARSTTSVCRCATATPGQRAGGSPTCARTRATSTCFFVDLRARRAGALRAPPAGQRALAAAAHQVRRPGRRRSSRRRSTPWRPGEAAAPAPARPHAALAAFVADVREEYFTVLAHLIDSRYYRTHGEPGRAAPGKYSAKRRGYVVSMGQDLAAVKISGWTHTIPEYFDFGRFWAGVSRAPSGGVAVTARPTFGRRLSTPTSGACTIATRRTRRRSTPRAAATRPARTRSRPTTSCSCTTASRSGSTPRRRSCASTATCTPTRRWARAASDYEGDSIYDRKALTDTEYAAYLVDFTRRVLGLSTEEASQVDLADHRARPGGDGRRSGAGCFELLSLNYMQLTPTGPYKFTIVESRPPDGRRRDRSAGAAGPPAPAPAASASARTWTSSSCARTSSSSASTPAPGGVQAVANGSEAKIADAMLRVLHHQGVLKDAGHDLRFNMRPGGNPGRGEFGGVVEAFLTPRRRGGVDRCVNRFGEPVRGASARARKTDAGGARSPRSTSRRAWRDDVDGGARRDGGASCRPARRGAGERPLPRARTTRCPAAARLVETTLARLSGSARRRLPPSRRGRAAGLRGARRRRARRRAARAHRAAQARRLRRPRRQGALDHRVPHRRRPRRRRRVPRAASYRLLDAVPPLAEVLAEQAAEARAAGARAPAAGRYGPPDRSRPATTCCRRTDAARDVLVVDFARLRERGVRPRLRLALRQRGGPPRLAQPRRLRLHRRAALPRLQPAGRRRRPGRAASSSSSTAARSATSSAPCSRAPSIWLYGQGQCHVGMKADSGYHLRAAGRAQHLLLRRARRHLQRLGLGLALRRRRPEQGRCSTTARRRRRASGRSTSGRPTSTPSSTSCRAATTRCTW